ncbi:hypothetical protein BC827DRAFT_103977 [Russula dissimulans]|nr:hypothetical protein BC827DRAFT_103977 [Russula dissimulans]
MVSNPFSSFIHALHSVYRLPHPPSMRCQCPSTSNNGESLFSFFFFLLFSCLTFCLQALIPILPHVARPHIPPLMCASTMPPSPATMVRCFCFHSFFFSSFFVPHVLAAGLNPYPFPTS